MRSNSILILILAASLCALGCSRGPGGPIETPSLIAAAQPVHVASASADASEHVMAAAGDGSVYVAWVEHRERQADVMVQPFGANGKPVGAPARVNPQAGEVTAWRGDPPTVASGNDGMLYVLWTRTASSPRGHTEDIYLSQSRDRGATFDNPVKVNDDRRPAGHGMHSMVVGPDGVIYIAWLDERNAAPPEQMPAPSKGGHHQAEANRDVFLAVSKNGGRSFEPNRRIASDACPCCKTAIAISPDNRLYVGWRQVLPGDFRHIAVASSLDKGESFSQPTIVSDDRWSIGGCPVSGPALSTGVNGRLEVLWYTAGNAGPEGLYFARSEDGGRTFEPRKMVYQGPSRGTPALIAGDQDGLYAVWEDSRTQSSRTMITGVRSNNPGDTTPTALPGAASLPKAAMNGGRLYLAYLDAK